MDSAEWPGVQVAAVEAAVRRRRQRPTDEVHVAACSPVLRAQPFGGGVAQHFRLFALVSSARDTESRTTQIGLLRRHIRFWQTVLAQLAADVEPQVEVSVFNDPVLAEQVPDTTLPHLRTRSSPWCPHLIQSAAGATTPLLACGFPSTRRHRSRRWRHHHLDRNSDRQRQGEVHDLRTRHPKTRRLTAPIRPSLSPARHLNARNLLSRGLSVL